MRIVIAPDKFAGTLTAAQAASCIATGWQQQRPSDDVILLPMADGGEGTIDALSCARPDLWIQRTTVHDPLGREVQARWLVTPDATAIIEVADACGLKLLASTERAPLAATSRGVGELIVAATEGGASQIIVGLGGSATVDGGIGAALALGARLHDSDGGHVPAERWWDADLGRFVPPAIDVPAIVLASDVRSVLLGANGAAHVFGPQKGATPEMVIVLEEAMTRLADVVETATGCAMQSREGAGAAGGLGFMLLALFQGELTSGAEVIADLIDLPAAIDGADVVVTGEGKLDAQTNEGKAPAHVARLGRAAGARVGAVVGICEQGAAHGFDAVVQTGPDGLRDPRGTVTAAAADLARAF